MAGGLASAGVLFERSRQRRRRCGLGIFPNNAPATCTAGQPDCLCINLIITTLCFPQSGGSCTVADYASPSVTLSLPPAHAAAITDIGLRKPGGGTPTRPALEGAIQYASTWAQSSHRKTVVVLATDGDPTGCTQNSPQDAAAIAAAALAGPAAIQTFVWGSGALSAASIWLRRAEEPGRPFWSIPGVTSGKPSPMP